MTHCDDYIDDEKQPKALRDFLRYKRSPAIEQRGSAPPLFANIKEAATGKAYLGYWDGNNPAMRDVPLAAGQRVRVVMASRFGDVGITPNLKADHGYVMRVSVDALDNFSETSG